MLAEVKHDFSRQFMADVQYTWSRSMDTSSAPYSEQLYPYDLGLNYGRSDYNVTNAFKLYGMWQPVFFHGSNSWLEKWREDGRSAASGTGTMVSPGPHLSAFRR